MYNPFTVGRRLRQQQQQINTLTKDVNEKNIQIVAKDAVISVLKKRISDMEAADLDMPLFLVHAQTAKIRVLDVKVKQGIDFQLIGAACCAFLTALTALSQRVRSRPIEMPTFPQSDVYTYRIYDEQEKIEREMGEREFKQLLKKRGEI